MNTFALLWAVSGSAAIAAASLTRRRFAHRRTFWILIGPAAGFGLAALVVWPVTTTAGSMVTWALGVTLNLALAAPGWAVNRTRYLSAAVVAATVLGTALLMLGSMLSIVLLEFGLAIGVLVFSIALATAPGPSDTRLRG